MPHIPGSPSKTAVRKTPTGNEPSLANAKRLHWFSQLFRVFPDGNRIYGLDIMRAAAILFVLVAHGDNLHNNETVKSINQWLGYDGVTVFFVLSGFLIGGILIRVIEKGDYSPKVLLRFWQRRWLRTLPAYYLILCLLLTLATVFYGAPMWQNNKRFFVFLQNFNTEHTVFFQEAWSLSVEEWFYLFVPVTVFILGGVFKSSHRNAVLLTALLVAAFSLGFRYYRYRHVAVTNFEAFDQVYRKQVIMRLDSLMAGVLGAYLAFYQKAFWQRHRRLCLWLGVLLLAGLKIGNSAADESYGLYRCVFSLPVETLIPFLFLPYLSQLKTGRGVVFKILTYISLVSYSLYLINFSLMQGWVLPKQAVWGLSEPAFILIRYLGFWVLSFLGATLLYKCVERPVLRLRK